MIKLIIGALLITATTWAQTPAQTGQTSSPKPASNAATSGNKSTKQTVTSAGTPSKSTTKSTSTSTAADAARRSPNKKIPKPSLSDNLESKDNAIPSYKQAKTGAGKERTQPKFTPRRTASGARPDTMNKRKP